ncbi:MAG: Calx-beta domain-containing protein, partial [Kiloniellaceae bacterium]
VAGDTDFESDEAFTVTLSTASGNSAITVASAEGTILNDDAAPPAIFYGIAADEAVKAEGDAGSTAFTFTVTRSGDTSAAGSVDYAVSGAADGTDFTGGTLPSGSLSFAAGEASKTVTVDVAGDTDFESDEAFTVTLSNASGNSAITVASAEGTILNDDAAPPTTFFAIAADDAVQVEGDIGETVLTFTVTRSGDTAVAGSVDYAVTGEVDGDDFPGGLLPSGSLAFAAGEVSKTISLNVAGDGDEEPDENLTVTLTNASAGAAITTASADGTILNDDGAPPPPIETYFSISAADAVKSEGDDGSTLFTFLVSRPGVVIGDASVDYTVTGSGSNPADAADFVGGILPSGTVTIQGEGASGATIIIEVAGDSAIEGDENFTVTLSNPSSGAAIVTAAASGTILNDDSSAVETVVLVDADFDGTGDTEGFTYVDGVFADGFFQRYADGEWSDGSLTIDLGGGDTRLSRDIAGAWETDFTLAEGMDVTLSFDYDITISSSYESDEFSQLLVSIDGGPAILVAELTGGGVLSSGEQSVVLDLGPLDAGSHSLAIGGYNNKKSWSDEATEISIDDVLVTGEAPGSSAASANGPFESAHLPGLDSGDLANPGLSETELLSTAGF